MRKHPFRTAGGVCSALLAVALFSACLPTPPAESGDINITLYAFSIMKEALEKGIYPAFVAKWKKEHGQEIHFTSSYAGSETITNQILQGVPCDIAILSIERDADRLKKAGFVTSDWRSLPHQGVVNKTPFIILVREGNPKGIHDFSDLAKPGVGLIHPDPVSSGGAQWSILAIYGSELKKSEAETGEPDQARSVRLLQSIWRNVKSTPGSAREARTQFETGFGDALITYELEGLLMKESKKTPVEIIVPKATILSEHPVVVIDRNVSAARRPVIEAFIQYLWSEEAQRAFVQFHFKSVDDQLNEARKDFGQIETPLSIDYFGGWDRAYPEIIEGVFRNRVQNR